MMHDPVLWNDWQAVAPVTVLENGQPYAVRLLDRDLVLWRAGDHVVAWDDLCLHRGTRLSLGKVERETLACPYHGWTYDRRGRCVLMPAHPEQTPPDRAQVATYHAQVRYGLIWVCLGTPAQEVPPFPEWDRAEYRKTFCGPYPVAASGPRIVENFLDVAHFPFVHGGILGDAAHAEISDYEAEVGHEGVIARNVRVYQPDPYGTGVGDTVTYTYRAYRPLTAYFVKESSDRGFSILLVVTPHSEVASTAWMWMAMNYGYEIPTAELIAYQDKIFGQDKPILESQRPELLPLDLQAELHLKSDRTAIAYRKWLRQLGLTFGTA